MIQKPDLIHYIFFYLKDINNLYRNILFFLGNLKSIFSLKKNNYLDKNKDNAEMKRDDKRFRVLFDLAPDGIMTVNLLGIITSANAAYYSLTGYKEEEIVGKHIFKVNAMQRENITKYAKMFASFLKGEKPDTVEFTYIHKDGSIRWADARFTLIQENDGAKEIIVILREITERKEKDAKLLNAMNELERSNKELDDYTFAVSHDLKAPLRTLDSFSSFLLDDYADVMDDVGKEYLMRMKSATERMKVLIEDLLTISRVGRKFTEYELVNLNEIIKGIIEDNEIIIKEKECKIICDELPTIMTQRIWIKQIFSNLLSNGLKFNTSKNPKIWINYEEIDDFHLFSVKDNGIGIERRHEKKIFSLFQRLHTQEEYPGSGAGLTICKKIVGSLGGEIWFDSEIDEGTTFYFTLLKEKGPSENIDTNKTFNDQISNLQNLPQNISSNNY